MGTLCATKVDFRSLGLSKTEASEALDALKNKKPLSDKVREHIEKSQSNKPAPKIDCAAIHKMAHEAGLENAANNSHLSPANVIQDGKVIDTIPDLCGFAWIYFHAKAGLNKTFARWAKENKIADKHYPTGFSIWVTGFGQSVGMKTAYAKGYAKVLNENGIEAHVGSRLD